MRYTKTQKLILISRRLRTNVKYNYHLKRAQWLQRCFSNANKTETQTFEQQASIAATL